MKLELTKEEVKYLTQFSQHFENYLSKKSQEKGSLVVNFKFDLLKRIYYNFQAIMVLYNDKKLSFLIDLPIGLLIRTCLADLITYLYIESLDEEVKEIAIKVLERSYIDTMEKAIVLHNQRFLEDIKNGIIIDYNPEIKENPRLILEEHINKIKNAYSDFYENGELKSINKLTNGKYKKKIECGFMYEELIKDEKYKDIKYLYSNFRYFSQFEHPSLGGQKMVDEDVKPRIKSQIREIARITFDIYNSQLT